MFESRAICLDPLLSFRFQTVLALGSILLSYPFVLADWPVHTVDHTRWALLIEGTASVHVLVTVVVIVLFLLAGQVGSLPFVVCFHYEFLVS